MFSNHRDYYFTCLFGICLPRWDFLLCLPVSWLVGTGKKLSTPRRKAALKPTLGLMCALSVLRAELLFYQSASQLSECLEGKEA